VISSADSSTNTRPPEFANPTRFGPILTPRRARPRRRRRRASRGGRGSSDENGSTKPFGCTFYCKCLLIALIAALVLVPAAQAPPPVGHIPEAADAGRYATKARRSGPFAIPALGRLRTERVDRLTGVHRRLALALVVRDADRDATGACAAFAVRALERDPVDTAVTGAAALGAREHII
jgi:hypothetical protein